MMYKFNIESNSLNIIISKKKHAIYIAMLLLYTIGFVVIPYYSLTLKQENGNFSSNYFMLTLIIMGFVYSLAALFYKWKKDQSYKIVFEQQSILVNNNKYNLTDIKNIEVTKITADYRFIYRISINLDSNKYTIMHYASEEDAEIISSFLEQKANCIRTTKQALFDLPWRW